VFPLTVLVFMTLVQWGLYFHATQVVDAAAQDAARALRASAGDDAARAAAEDLLAPARASGLLHEPTVDHTIDAGTVTVNVTGTVTRLVPLPLDLRVKGVSSGPIETYVSEPDRQ
jgi:Flp pilus assembly protein TadG